MATWPAGLELRYDRRVDPEFLAAFAPGGAFAAVTDYARFARFPVDLHFRANGIGGDQFASIYVGLTNVLRFSWLKRTRQVKLSADESWARHGLNGEWVEPGTLVEWSTRSHELTQYLDAVIPAAMTTRHVTREGIVQSSASTFDDPRRTLFDREFVVRFSDEATKKRVREELDVGIADALGTAAIPGAQKQHFGGKCDLVGVDDVGRFLAIEIKPAEGSEIVWAAAQAVTYARIIQRWFNTDAGAVEIISDQIERRKSIGLLPDRTAHRLIGPVQVVPIVAVQRGNSVETWRRMEVVRRALIDGGVSEASAIEWYEINLAGRMEQVDYSYLV